MGGKKQSIVKKETISHLKKIIPSCGGKAVQVSVLFKYKPKSTPLKMTTRLALLLFSIVNILSYEEHLYETYSNYIKLISFILLLLIILIHRHKNHKVEKPNNLLTFLFFLIFVTYIISSYHHYVLSSFPYLTWSTYIKMVISITWILTALLFLDVKTIFLIFDSIFYIGLFLSFLNLIIYFNNGFLFWDRLMIFRGGSVFFDPNYWAAFNLFLILYFLFFKRDVIKFSINIALIVILIVSLILSFSKSSILSLTVVTIIYLFIRSSRYLKVIIIVFSSLIGYLAYFLIESIPYFRIEMGLNNRDNMWKFFLLEISNNPLFGFGEDGIKYKLVTNNLENWSFHNFLLDKTFGYGLILGILLLMLSFTVFYILYKYNKYLSLIYLALFINSNFIDYSLGGLGTNSLLFTLFYILASKINSYRRFKTNENCSRGRIICRRSLRFSS